MRSLPIAALTLFAPALLAPALLAQAKTPTDTVRRTGGQILRRVEVVAETLKGVTIKRAGREEEIPANEVAAVEWGDPGETYARATIATERNDHKTAANLYQEAADKTDRPGFKAHAAYLAGEALSRAAATDASMAPVAAKAIQTWLEANPEHRLMPRARQMLGQAWIGAGNGDEAMAAFKNLETEVGNRNLGTAWIARAKFGQGQALVLKKDYQNARQAYLSASATLATVAGGDDPEIAALMVSAKVGEGECYLEEKRYPDARQFFNRLATEGATRSPTLVTAARCGEAQAMFEMAKAKKDKRELREAQLIFAQVSATDLLDADATAKALYHLAHATLELGKEYEGADFALRAETMLQEVAKRFPASRWGVAAASAKK